MTEENQLEPSHPEKEDGESTQSQANKSVERRSRSMPQPPQVARTTRADDHDWQYQSVLERIIEKQIKLKDYGTDPKKLLLWLGIQLAKFWRRKGQEPRREERLLLGKPQMCCVYPRWWYGQHGDYRLTRECGYIQQHPDLLARVKEYPDYDQRCRDQVEELKRHQERKEERANPRTN